MFIDSPTVDDVLRDKAGKVITIGMNEAIEAAARELSERRIGLLVVTGEDGRVAGLISERDIVAAVAKLRGCQIDDTLVRSVMTTDVIFCSRGDLLTDVLNEMNVRRIRHMPVLDDSAMLVGLLSIGDVLGYLKNDTATINDEVLWSHFMSHI